ncbi:CYTH domain-containing protein [Streptomyces sp. NPDC004031]
MAVEIERRFLVTGDGWQQEATGSSTIVQGYLSLNPERIVRVRLVDGARARITVKGLRVGNRRHEFEYAVPADDARFMLAHLCVTPCIEKRRAVLGRRSPGEWVVDSFGGANTGLVVAEVEYDGTTAFDLPPWLGREISADDRYANSALVRAPYTAWAAHPGGE